MPMTANGLPKLLEEISELGQVAAKKLAYYKTNTHPDGAGLLNELMEDEMGDVVDAINFVRKKFDLNESAITARAERKLKVFEDWDADQLNGADAFDAPSVLLNRFPS